MRPDQRAREEREVLDAVGVRALDAVQAVQLLLRELAGRDGRRAVFGQVLARADVVVDAVVVFEGARGDRGVGEEELEDYGCRCVGWRWGGVWRGALEAEGCEEGGHGLGWESRLVIDDNVIFHREAWSSVLLVPVMSQTGEWHNGRGLRTIS